MAVDFDHVGVPMAHGIKPWRVSMETHMFVCMAYLIYVAFIANMVCVMWIVRGVCSRGLTKLCAYGLHFWF